MPVRNKSTVFDVVLKQKSASQRYDIVIVHPFHQKSHRAKVFRDAFSDFQRRLSNHPVVCEVSNIYLFSFKGKSIISGKVSVKEISDELLRRLGEQREPIRLDFYGDVQYRAVGHGNCQPRMLFIAHSLGAWVVKTVLLQNNQPNVSIFKTQGTIFLDSGTLSRQYLLNLYQLFLRPYARTPGELFYSGQELVRLLDKIDSEYRSFVGSSYVREERLKDQMTENIAFEQQYLWMPHDTVNLGTAKASKRKRISRLPYLARLITTNQRYDTHIHIDEVQALKNLQLEDLLASWINQTQTRHLVRDRSVPTSRSQSIYSLTPAWYRKGGYSTTSIDTIISDRNRASIGSAPNIPINDADDNADDLRQIINIGKSFVRKGELSNAETAFQRASALLNSKDRPQEFSGYSLEVDVQLACITLYKGKYEDAQERFGSLLHSTIPEQRIRKEYTAVILRWIGVALLHQGRHQEAAEHFRLLLTRFAEFSSDEVQIRRDLAISSAYLGNFHDAFRELKNSFDCLENRERHQELERDSYMGSMTPRTEASNIPSMQLATDSRLSSMHNQGKHPSKEFLRELPTDFELRAQRYGLYFAQAKIGLAWGSFEKALKDSEKALLGMKRRLGPGYLKTLECASLNALLLALNSQTRAAEIACIATHRAMTTELGSDHPLTLEAMRHLVRIYQLQSRFLEALDTSTSLARVFGPAQGEKRPQILQYRCIRAESELKIGNYANAELELENIAKIAKAGSQDIRLDTLHYQITLALAYHHGAKNKQAEDLARHVLRDQLKIYTTCHAHVREGFERCKNVGEDLTSHLAKLSNIASLEHLDHMVQDLIDKSLISRIPPPLLQTLWVISLILLQKEDPASLALATTVLQSLWDRSVEIDQVGSQDALRIRYHLALAIRRGAEAEKSDGDGGKRLRESAKHFRSVYLSRSQVQGHANPDTLSAKLELIITDCALGRWEEINNSTSPSVWSKLDKRSEEQGLFPPNSFDNEGWRFIITESRKILHLLEAQLGKNHPETLKSRLWVLAVETLLRDVAAATETAEEALKQLRTVRMQRLVESVNLECRVASIVVEFDRQWAEVILIGTRDAIQNCQVSSPETRNMLDKMIAQELHCFGDMSQKEVLS